jgi:hypothetical protein
MPPVAGFHLHLYQPPREDPWLGLVTNEWSAWPYHDWNERITDECYRALVAVALATGDDSDVELVEPLSQSIFDVAPTLHRWLARESPDVDRALAFQATHAPGGASAVAMAAPLVHAILPLASEVDCDRLVAWGIADYTARFGEAPRGLWLPETAVDRRTLDALARHGIEFTILMATQAVRVRELGGEWRSVNADSLDTSLVYRVTLEGGRAINVVFGHRDLSQRVAFGELLADGAALADEMAGALGGDDGVVLLVADGETYGHHHRFGDLGLAWALRRLREDHHVETALGPWLDRHEATHEVELAVASAWSCAHGVERWRSDCGCVTGGRPGWRQTWRAPLRDALDWLRENLGRAVDERLAELVDSPEATLLAYGEVLAGATSNEEFVAARAARALDEDETVTVLELCEVHRHLLYSFTSCAWFFADPADIETSIVLRHAAVALESARRVLGLDLEPPFLQRLAAVHSNLPGFDGRVLWRRACEPYRFDEEQIAAGFAAEHLARGEDARADRGDWRADVAPLDDAGGAVVDLANLRTGRRRSFTTRVTRVGALGVRVCVEGATAAREFDMVDLGLDVVARVATAWLVGPSSTDFEGALRLVVAEFLTRPVTRDDVEVLLALAGAPRCVTPSGEASIRRAILAAVGGSDTSGDLELLSELTGAVGLSQALTRS